jgi:hypothetical protein
MRFPGASISMAGVTTMMMTLVLEALGGAKQCRDHLQQCHLTTVAAAVLMAVMVVPEAGAMMLKPVLKILSEVAAAAAMPPMLAPISSRQTLVVILQ